MSEARPLGGRRRAALALAVLGLLALATASGVVTYRRKRLPRWTAPSRQGDNPQFVSGRPALFRVQGVSAPGVPGGKRHIQSVTYVDTGVEVVSPSTPEDWRFQDWSTTARDQIYEAPGGAIVLQNLVTGAVTTLLDPGAPLKDFAVSPAGDLVAFVTSDNSVALRSLDGAPHPRSVVLPESQTQDEYLYFAFSPRGDYVAARIEREVKDPGRRGHVDRSGYVTLWSVRTAGLVRRVEGELVGVTSRGDALVRRAGSRDRSPAPRGPSVSEVTVSFADGSERALAYPLGGTVCLSQDGERLASRERAGDDGEAIVVRAVGTGAELRRILSPPGRYARCLRMSDEGDLVMIEYEGLVEVWDVPP